MSASRLSDAKLALALCSSNHSNENNKQKVLHEEKLREILPKNVNENVRVWSENWTMILIW